MSKTKCKGGNGLPAPQATRVRAALADLRKRYPSGAALARALGVHKGTVSRALRASTAPARALAEKVAKLLKVDVEDLFAGVGPREQEKLRRYSFLIGNPARSDEEEVEMVRLRDALKTRGIDPGWTSVPRGTVMVDDNEVIP